VKLSDGVTLDYAEPGVDFPGQHYAFLGGRGVYFQDPSGHDMEALTAAGDSSCSTK
jgi:hypothetical protein